eukprot:3594378-Rhodomonas_salina.1
MAWMRAAMSAESASGARRESKRWRRCCTSSAVNDHATPHLHAAPAPSSHHPAVSDGPRRKSRRRSRGRSCRVGERGLPEGLALEESLARDDALERSSARRVRRCCGQTMLWRTGKTWKKVC